MAYSCPLTLSHIKAARLGEPRDGREGGRGGHEGGGVCACVHAGEVGGGCLDGGIPYLVLRGCCSVVRDCLELPPVPGIFEGNTKACDGPDLLELPFFYVSLHFLLCYTPPHPLHSLLLFSLLLSPLSHLHPHTQPCLPFRLSPLSSDIFHFTTPLETF